MRNPLDTPFAEHLSLLVARVPIGAYFLLAGIGKFRSGVETFVHTHAGDVPHWFPGPLGQGYLYLVPFVEVIAGTLVIVGLFTRIAAAVMTLMLASFIIAVTGVTDPKLPFAPNVIYIGLTILLTVFGGGSFALGRAFSAGAGTPVKVK